MSVRVDTVHIGVSLYICSVQVCFRGKGRVMSVIAGVLDR